MAHGTRMKESSRVSFAHLMNAATPFAPLSIFLKLDD